MQETDIFTLKGLYRDDFRIRGYRFGGGEKTLCVVGAMRGNENQQLYAASQLVRRLSLLEKAGTVCLMIRYSRRSEQSMIRPQHRSCSDGISREILW